MNTYRIMLRCESVLMDINGVNTRCGFIKTEYIWAQSRQTAVNRAKHRLLENCRKSNLTGPEGEIKLEVDEIEEGVSFWRALTHEGFVFFRNYR
jgi:hypothetical protein